MIFGSDELAWYRLTGTRETLPPKRTRRAVPSRTILTRCTSADLKSDIES